MKTSTKSILFVAGIAVLVSVAAVNLRGTEKKALLAGAATVLRGTEKEAPLAGVATVRGDYIEARTCDVWTGPCFSNAEINVVGDNAIMGWIVSTGSWAGVRLDGLQVCAVLDAEGTLGTDAEGPVKSVVFVDLRADQAQRKALIGMARSLAPKYLKNIVDVRREKITYRREGFVASLKIGTSGKIGVATMALNAHCDLICGNEEKAYPSLSRTLVADCAKTVANRFQTSGLGVQWSDPGTRSAMLGTFEAGSSLLTAAPR